jgi:hypothetical protein
MKIRIIIYSVLFAGIVGMTGCKSENTALKNDAKIIAETMCKNLEAMKRLKSANPSDSVLLIKLQSEHQKIQEEMAMLFQKFKTKYGDKAMTKEFNEEFRKYLDESMLDCKSLSKEERETFERGL